MKNFFMRLIAILLGLALLAMGIFIIAASSELLPLLGTRFGLGAEEVYPIIGLAGGLAIIAAIIFLAFGAHTSRKPVETTLQYSELGEVRISIAAIESMVLRVTQQHRAIKESDRKVLKTPQGLQINLRVKVLPDFNLPSLASELQQSIGSYVEEITGMKVAEVKVLVDNIVSDLAVQKKSPVK